MPGANFWAVLLFFTLIVLGFSSAFVMLDVVATCIVDSGAIRLSRPTVVTILTLVSFLMCLPYCTEFGYYLLDGIDRWVNNVALIFVVWSEVVSATTAYRWKDVVDQTGLPAFIVYNIGYFLGQILIPIVGHTTGNPGAGIGAGVGFSVLMSIAAVTLTREPTAPAASFWNRNTWAKRFWSGSILESTLATLGTNCPSVFHNFHFSELGTAYCDGVVYQGMERKLVESPTWVSC